jgi:atypical dual specificity phosphatase
MQHFEHYSYIVNNLYLGDINSGILAKTSSEFHLVLNCARDCDYDPPSHFAYKHLLLNDNPNETILHLFDINVKYIHQYISSGQNVLVHCYSGKSRSGSFILAYLIQIKNMTLIEAYDFVRKKRNILPNLSFMKELITYDKMIHGKSSFNLNSYTVTFIAETFEIDEKKVEYVFNMNSQSFDKTIDALFPFE